MAHRKRASNFNATEKEFLVGIVKNYAHIVECKKTNTNQTLQEKNQAWEEIAAEFNATFGEQREVAQLRKAWENNKLRNKKNSAEANNRVFKAGKF